MSHAPRDDYCYLTTVGRRTGRKHRIEIWYADDGKTLYLLSGGGRSSDWVRNLLVNAEVEVDIDGDDRRGRARGTRRPAPQDVEPAVRI